MTAYKLGYCRTSTRQQDLGIQRDALVRAGVDPGHIFEEQESGAKRNRPVLAQVLKQLRAGDTFVCWKYDRIARSAVHLLTIVEDLHSRGVIFRSITEDINTGTPAGKLFVTMLAGFAEFERNMIEERREAGLKRARDKGVKFGRKSADDPTAKTDKSGRLAKALLAVSEGQSVRSAAKENRIGEATIRRHISARTSGAEDTAVVSARKSPRKGSLNGVNGYHAELT